jgi:threonyl-tRNA synthetase
MGNWLNVSVPLRYPRTTQLLTLADNFCFVVGDDEMRNRKVNIRYRDDTSTQARDVPVDLEDALLKLRQLKADRGMYNPFPHKKDEEKEEKK